MLARAMPYEMRLKNYHREKNDLFYRISEMTPAEIDRANKELIRKWRI